MPLPSLRPRLEANLLRELGFYGPRNDTVGGSYPLTSGFLSIVHSSGIEFLLGERIRGLSP